MHTDKGTLTVIGTIDPACLANKIRKSGKVADIISVGPPKPPEPKPAATDPPKPLPPYCNNCQIIAGAAIFSTEIIHCSIL